MKKSLSISGMTCGNCENHVREKIATINGVTDVLVSLKNGNAVVYSENEITDDSIENILGDKYSVSNSKKIKNKSKIRQLKPLFLIFAYLIFGTFYLNKNDFNLEKAMINFMGLFFITFSFFKLIDYSTFPLSFSRYDPLAKKIFLYAKLYPFLELILGICFLFNWKINIVSFITFCVLTITTFGVVKALFNKKEIECACLGTSMKLPMTEATLLENIVMISMALFLLI